MGLTIRWTQSIFQILTCFTDTAVLSLECLAVTAASSGKFSGVAPGVNLVGLSAGDLSLLYVLEGFDYLLANGNGLNVRVVNCSFSANTVFDVNDPVNVATKILTDNGINVVFSAGNTGPGQHTLNPYAVAPWVVSVGATDTQGRLASFSSRGDFASGLFRPTVVAPGVNVVSLRGGGIVNVTGAEGIANSDLQRLSSSELPYYTTASGTSFSAPQVAGTIALMLEANPDLTPANVRRHSSKHSYTAGSLLRTRGWRGNAQCACRCTSG